MCSFASDGTYLVRAVRAHEWSAVKALRLEALQDPVAHLAFLETYADAVTQPDSFWQERTAGACAGATGAQQFIAEGPDGTWVGTVTVLLEEPGTTDWSGQPVQQRQGHVVGVYVRPEHRGSGLTEVLFDEAVRWARQAGAERMRLFVHEDNGRAERFYRKAGFTFSGRTTPLPARPEEKELEYVLDLA
ncbi:MULTISPECIES: GNAT family N-acetyltransferase [Streptomyces]|uniref:GNAT family N-acetyltransferase n=1 Tax=Streptomyces thermoviolaceus subsp. thermoviolaceus TaxID=66860 RepID=A0ABX0YS19_STRTL|nr:MULTISPECIES: GNAT family N-acetyltransferase [Streptomyces]MCM3264801.1 GNAT family N-acetyltransferase [Streptomyces thermoviolaceus]NJP15371.1 GNAT family N-acetyltransferase [Streptomyces thermoviolaceus subsp. thermoviolaceus]RSR95280.1 GNAT family N-acetyltransferase [Streptomyces sp. WAC00469]WTD48608.1 GNAT family N-acetyltransferase [Streptomyces thermoviolaceus]GGV70089.1 N-acetyltransferase [Streptomyces thermoviolaceus subsp. apingens]